MSKSQSWAPPAEILSQMRRTASLGQIVPTKILRDDLSASGASPEQLKEGDDLVDGLPVPQVKEKKVIPPMQRRQPPAGWWRR